MQILKQRVNPVSDSGVNLFLVSSVLKCEGTRLTVRFCESGHALVSGRYCR